MVRLDAGSCTWASNFSASAARSCAAIPRPTFRSQVYAGGQPVAPNPDQACATSFGNTDTMAAAITY
jgi:hypothetical protein